MLIFTIGLQHNKFNLMREFIKKQLSPSGELLKPITSLLKVKTLKEKIQKSQDEKQRAALIDEANNTLRESFQSLSYVELKMFVLKLIMTI